MTLLDETCLARVSKILDDIRTKQNVEENNTASFGAGFLYALSRVREEIEK